MTRPGDTKATASGDVFVVPARSAHDPNRAGLSTAEAARLLGVTTQAIVQSMQRGSLPGYRIAGRQRDRWFVYRDAVDPAASEDQALRGQVGALKKQVNALENELSSQKEANEKLEAAHAALKTTLTQLVESYRGLLSSDELHSEAVRLASSVQFPIDFPYEDSAVINDRPA